MSRKNSTNKQSRKQITYSFVRCELRKEDRDKAKAFITKNNDVMASKVHSLCGEGVKLSISLSKENDTFTASATGQEGSVNEGLILTARHKDWWTAVGTLIFKHEILFDRGPWEGDDEDEDGWS